MFTRSDYLLYYHHAQYHQATDPIIPTPTTRLPNSRWSSSRMKALENSHGNQAGKLQSLAETPTRQ